MNGNQQTPAKLKRSDAETETTEVRYPAPHCTFPVDRQPCCSQLLFGALGSALSDAVYYKDLQGNILGCNEAFAAMASRPVEEIIGKTVSELFPPELAQKYQVAAQELLNTGGIKTFEGALPQGESFRQLRFQKAVFYNQDGCAGGIVGAVLDITERQQTQKRIEKLAYYDALTGLPNRTLFRMHIERLLATAKREGQSFALFFLDKDRFTAINESLGYAAGDTVLKTVAQRLSRFMMENRFMNEGMLARVGGDKFGLAIYPLVNLDQSTAITRKVLEILREPLTVNGHEICCNGHIGIAVFPEAGEEVDLLLETADSAMYQAKRKGRNTWQYYSPEISQQNLEQLTLETDLRHAVTRNELFLHYQPLMELASGRIAGVEALVRWQHPRLGMVAPDRFISIAEESGQINDIGEWVLRTACRQNRAWQEQGHPPFRVAVNLSGLQLLQPHFTGQIDKALEESGLDPSWLELELTESTIMKNPEDIRILKSLKALGLHLAIDDFGTGYSSLAYLKRFPIDKLKIDRSFIRHITADPEDATIVEAIIVMAHRLGLRVVAEGVETREQLDFLRQCSCDNIQGYFLGRPMPAEDIAAFLSAHPSL